MAIRLNTNFSASSNVHPDDVNAVKQALNQLGYYQPDKKLGMTSIPDHGVFTALKSFQQDNDLPASGGMRPGDRTEQALNDAMEDSPTDNPAMPALPPGKVDSDPLPPPVKNIPGTDIPDHGIPEQGNPRSDIPDNSDDWRGSMDPGVVVVPPQGVDPQMPDIDPNYLLPPWGGEI